VLNSLRFGLDGINGEVVSTVFSPGTARSRAKSEQFGVSCQERDVEICGKRDSLSQCDI
jgi:hypothetical protein